MAQEIKNTFLKSKMNKDLDDRILPNGEYRDARNISVGRSEDNDVGALENIIGNNLVTGTDIGNGLTIIGIEADNSTDRLFVFLTDYEDPDIANPTNAPSTSKHYIYSYNSISGDYTLLVQGNFLNFSTTNRIVGVNLIENLLFWTDNRNQPRKINVNLAVAFEAGTIAAGDDYYTAEHQISVAKYNPYQAIELYNRADLQVLTGATATVFEVAGHRKDELLPLIGATAVCSEALSPTFGTDFVKVISITNSFVAPDTTIITVSPALNSAPAAGQYVTLIKSTMSNKNSDSEWPGDPDYLEDKFVRFSYRFKFDDNEYSLMAPFTQIAYIPKQNGYFVNGDENAAYQSTVLEFMENLVQNVGLIIPLPCSANELVSNYKINELEILFRESDGIAVKVLESVTAGEISGASGINNSYTYEYQSRKPYRTLPEAQTIRVYDKVPVRALAQETAGNRIIYGNFVDKHTPPANINYNCKIADKSTSGAYNNWIEYPNHSVKRNRNYQVGFVLADKFGRQSPVILSSVDLGAESNGQFFSGSTIYSPYDLISTDTDVDTWFGDAIQVLVNEPITSDIDASSGTPGLYAIKAQYSPNTGEGFAISAWTGATITNTTWTFRLDPTYTNNANIPRVGDYLRGAYEDFVEVESISGPTGPSQYTVTTKGPVSDSYYRTDNLPSGQPDLRFAYSINDLGWYSYKIVVKQTEQEYYNVYLPGILNGYPGQSRAGIDLGGLFPNDELNLTAHTVLFNDNINKVPRDLKEVGDQDKQFRSSVSLYGRVSNLMYNTLGTDPANPGNAQYYPRLNSTGKNAIDHTATTISVASDLEMAYIDLSASTGTHFGGRDGNLVFYQIDTNPLIARISTTEKSIGWAAEQDPNPSSGTSKIWNMQPYLAIYETAPFESNLDLYWETTSEGLIVDLNTDVASSNAGVAGFENLTWEFKEDDGAGTAVTGYFSPVNNEGQGYVTAPIGQLISTVDGLGVNVDFFNLEPGAVGTAEEGKFRIIYTGQGIVFNSASPIRNVYTFVIKMTTSDGDVSQITIGGEVGGFGALQNVVPSFSVPASIVKTVNDRVIITGATFASAENGTILTGLSDREGLVFRFDTLPGSDVPDNWTMDPNSGKLTQSVPGDAAGASREFTGNELGTYNIRIKVSDASDSNTNNTTLPYQSLVAFQDIAIVLGEAAVNPGALSTTCVVAPSSSPLDPVAWASSGFYGGQIYYISDSSGLNIDDFLDNGVVDVINEGGTPIKIGTESHKNGQICLTLNMSGFNSWVGGPPFALLYYRISGNTQWIPIRRSMELNRVGQGANSYNGQFLGGPYDSGPQPVNPTGTFNPPFNLALQSSGAGDWYCSWVRAFDYLDIKEEGSLAGVEYAIVTQNMQTFSGVPETTLAWVVADDLNYPKCIPWQGANLVNSNGGEGSFFKYIRSSGGSSAVDWSNISSSTDFIYSRVGYGDYVGTFYTDSNGINAYIPSPGSNYINVKLDKSALSPVPPTWKTMSGAQVVENVDLQWVVGYSTENGSKIQSLNSNEGVSAVQVSGGAPSGNFFYTVTGTGRIGLL